MGMGRIASIIVLTGLIATPVLAQQAAPPGLQRPDELRVPGARPKADSGELGARQPTDRCDGSRARIIREPDQRLPDTTYYIPQKPRPFDPTRDAGKLCPATPGI